MNTPEHYVMKPPYVVLRRATDDLTDQADLEWYMGHRPRVWMPWRKPYAKWEKYHIAIHDGLYRFHTEEQAKLYVWMHKDLAGELIEYVHVTMSEP